MDTSALRDLSYGVYAVTTLDGARPTGCIANSVMQITSSPATVAVSLNHNNYTNACVAKTGRFAVSVLGESCPQGFIGQFGFQCGKTADKFDGIPYEDRAGLPVPTGVVSWLLCEVVSTLETDTHTIFLARVTDAGRDAGGPPMTYAYYHRVLRGKSPKNAPTYQPEQPLAPAAPEPAPSQAGTIWRCSVCGYIYDGPVPFEELPEDFRCPVCKQPKSVFVKQG